MALRLPPKFRELVPADFEPHTVLDEGALAAVVTLCSKIETGVPVPETLRGLTIIGRPGVGKTMLGCIVAAHALRCRKSIDFVPVADFVNMGHRLISYSKRLDRLDDDEVERYRALEERIEQMCQVKVLVLDDFGKEHSRVTAVPGAAGWAESEFDRIIRRRWNTGAGPTIITTNVGLSDWEARYRASLVSFLHEATFVIEMSDQDDRRVEV